MICSPTPLCLPTEQAITGGPKPPLLSGFSLLISIALRFTLRPSPRTGIIYPISTHSSRALHSHLCRDHAPALGPAPIRANLEGKYLSNIPLPRCTSLARDILFVIFAKFFQTRKARVLYAPQFDLAISESPHHRVRFLHECLSSQA